MYKWEEIGRAELRRVICLYSVEEWVEALEE